MTAIVTTRISTRITFLMYDLFLAAALAAAFALAANASLRKLAVSALDWVAVFLGRARPAARTGAARGGSAVAGCRRSDKTCLTPQEHRMEVPRGYRTSRGDLGRLAS